MNLQKDNAVYYNKKCSATNITAFLYILDIGFANAHKWGGYPLFGNAQTIVDIHAMAKSKTNDRKLKYYEITFS